MAVGSTRLILASASPRRRELLAQLYPDFDVYVCPFDEPPWQPERVSPQDWAQALAHYKARAVAEEHKDRWVLGADTIVVCADRVLGKARDVDDAREMLVWQAQHPADVLTGLCVLRRTPGPVRLTACDCTRVWMRDDPEQREAYLASGDWIGKAGAYGIQDVGDRLVARIEGSFSNVVGLPLERLAQLLHDAGLLPRGPVQEHAA